ncbi:hypothetical protein BKA62DRAFT_201189 [Auriculariales sp. MPI-PUGE-AT-0066]|nr:hypothetical protein BKA62DRAFT_201189 [Auriculariales sp. MPI-PUGE-AT-0066]
MVSKTLSAVWACFAVALLAAGCISIAYSINWAMPNMVIQFVIDRSFLKAGLALGGAYIFTFVVAFVAVAQPTAVTFVLAGLNWVIILDMLMTLVIGSVIWMHTLKEQSMYREKWFVADPDIQRAIQDEFRCCGYASTTESNMAMGGFCADSTIVAQQSSCQQPFMLYADWTLNTIFTAVYGFQAILIGLFLASCCMINKRIEAERFRKIDLKRGGGGFV